MNQLRNIGEATWYSFTQALNTFMGFPPSLQITRSWYNKGMDLADRIKQRSEVFPHSDVYSPRMGGLDVLNRAGD
jgi:hypothetical protein